MSLDGHVHQPHSNLFRWEPLIGNLVNAYNVAANHGQFFDLIKAIATLTLPSV